MTLFVPGKFTLGAAAALLALIALFLVVVVTSTGSVEGSGEDCWYDEALMEEFCTQAEQSTPEPTPEFDPARWMPVPAVLHDGTLSRPKNTGSNPLMPPMPPIDGFDYSFGPGIGLPSANDYPADIPPSTTNVTPTPQDYPFDYQQGDSGEASTSSSLNSGETINHRIIVGSLYPPKPTPAPPPLRIWFDDEGYGASYQRAPQSRMRIATGPFTVPVQGFNLTTDAPDWSVGSTTIAAPWFRLKAYSFEGEVVWRTFEPIRFDPGRYDRDQVLRTHKAEAQRRVRLMAQNHAASYPNARNVRITVSEVSVTQVPNTVGGRDEFYDFEVTATVTGTEDGLELNKRHSSYHARQVISRLEETGMVFREEIKARVNGRDYPGVTLPITSPINTSLETLVGLTFEADGVTIGPLTNAIHQINMDGTIVFGVQGVEVVSGGVGCRAYCLPGQ